MTEHISRRFPLVLVSLSVSTVVLSVYAASVLRKPSAVELFHKHVLDPIPASVMHIRVDQPKTIGGYGYVFRFAVNRADLELIRKSRPFREAEIYVGADSLIDWTWKGLPSSGNLGEIGSGFLVYGPGCRQPSWFDLALWRSPEAYALVKKDENGNVVDSQLLIYADGSQTAYFITFHYGGGPPPFFWGKRRNQSPN